MAGHELPPEYDAELTVCGEAYFLKRSIGLMRRLEQRYGPLPTLMGHLQSLHVTQEQLSGIYAELLRGCDGAPDRAAIAAWIFAEGTAPTATPLVNLIMAMFIGSKRLREIEDRRMAAAEDAGANPTHPAMTPDQLNPAASARA